MKNIALIILCIIGTIGLFTPGSAVAQGRNEPVFTVAEQQPEFPGGNTALSRYLAENIKFPNSLSRKNYNTGPVSAKFIVGKDGVVRDVRVTSKPLDKKTQKGMQDFMTTIISAIEKMPRWQPGEVNGKPVAVFYTLPIEVSMQ